MKLVYLKYLTKPLAVKTWLNRLVLRQVSQTETYLTNFMRPVRLEKQEVMTKYDHPYTPLIHVAPKNANVNPRA